MNKIWQQEVNNIINKDGLNFKEALIKASNDRKKNNPNYKTVRERTFNHKQTFKTLKRKQKVSLNNAKRIFKKYYKFKPSSAILDMKKKNKKTLTPNSKKSYLFRNNGPKDYDMKGLDDGVNYNKNLFQRLKNTNTLVYKHLYKNLNKNTNMCSQTADQLYTLLTQSNNIDDQRLLNLEKLKSNRNYVLRVNINPNSSLDPHSVVIVLHNNKAYLIQSYVQFYEHSISVHNRATFIKHLKSLDYKKYITYFIKTHFKPDLELKVTVKRTIKYLKLYRKIYKERLKTILHDLYKDRNPTKTSKNIVDIIKKYGGKEDKLIEALEERYNIDLNYLSIQSYDEELETIIAYKDCYSKLHIKSLINFLNDFIDGKPKYFHKILTQWRTYLETLENLDSKTSFNVYTLFFDKPYFSFNLLTDLK